MNPPPNNAPLGTTSRYAVFVAVALLALSVGAFFFFQNHTAAPDEKNFPLGVVTSENIREEIPLNINNSTSSPVENFVDKSIQINGIKIDSTSELSPEIKEILRQNKAKILKQLESQGLYDQIAEVEKIFEKYNL